MRASKIPYNLRMMLKFHLFESQNGALHNLVTLCVIVVLCVT